jgi:hypothetical protein
MRNGLDLSSRSYGLIWSKTAFRIDEMSGEDSIDEG